MADIHILPENGEAVAIPEERIPELLGTGNLSPTALYWREGMADWEPLATFRLPIRASARRTEPVPIGALAERTPPGPNNARGATSAFVPAPRSAQAAPVAAAEYSLPSPRPPARSRYRFRRNPWPLTIILELVLAACLVITLLEMAQELALYQQLSSSLPAAPDASSSLVTGASPLDLAGLQAPALKNPTGHFDHLLQRCGWVANLLLLVPYFMWLYRTTVNCRHLSTITRLQPALAIGNYFIPFVNLFRPCQDMQEIWRVSGNPRSWLNDRGSILVGVWWVLALVTIGTSIETMALFSAALTHDDDVFASLFFLGLKSLQAAWYISFLLLVGLIMRRQAKVIVQGRQRGKAPATASS